MYCAAVIQKNTYPADSVVLFSCFSGFMNKFLNRYVKPTLSHETLSKHKIFFSLLGKTPRVVHVNSGLHFSIGMYFLK